MVYTYSLISILCKTRRHLINIFTLLSKILDFSENKREVNYYYYYDDEEEDNDAETRFYVAQVNVKFAM